MRIALVVTEFVSEKRFDGGLATYTQHLAISLSRAGHEPVVFIEADQDRRFRHEGIMVQRVKYRRVFCFAVLNLLSFRRLQIFFNFMRLSWNLNTALKRQQRQTPFDLVQYTHLGGVAFFRPRRIPAVVRLSSYTPWCYRFGQYAGLSRFQIGQQILPENLALKRADAVFAPSRQVAELVQRENHVQVSVLESPFVPEIAPEDERLYQEQLAGKDYLLYFGRISAAKGVLVIAAAMQEILRRHGHLHFVFVGRETSAADGRSTMAHVLELAGECRHRLLYLGCAIRPQLFPIIRKASAVVLPSLTENFPNACLEAMAVGQITVATRQCGFDQLIQDGVSGWLCRPADPGDLLVAVDKALGMNAAARERMATAAKSRVAELNPERVAAAHLAFYQAAIAKKNSAARDSGKPFASRFPS